MKCSLDISKFLEDIPSILFYCFPLFHCIAYLKAFLISLCYTLEICSQLGISFPFSFAFHFSFFSPLFVKPPQTTSLPSCVSFSLGRFWSPPPVVQCYEDGAVSLPSQFLRPRYTSTVAYRPLDRGRAGS